MTEANESLPPLVLTWAKPGDVVDVWQEIPQRFETVMVLTGCETIAKGYHCVSCSADMANVGNLVMHLEDGGTHHIVVWCPVHRVHEAASPEQVEGFRRAVTP